jgi:hypothetical protein
MTNTPDPSDLTRVCLTCGEPEEGPLGWFDHETDGLICNGCGSDPLKKKRIPKAVREAAARLGRLGGLTRSAKRAAASRANGKLGGPPRFLPVGVTGAQRYHLKNIAAQGGVVITEKQQLALDAVARLRQLEEQESK